VNLHTNRINSPENAPAVGARQPPNPVISPTPRYHTEAQIVALIDSSVKKSADLEQRSWELERQAVALIEASAKTQGMTKADRKAYLIEQQHPYDQMYETRCALEAKSKRATAAKLLLRAKSITEKKLPKLKGKLAEFRTSQIPAIDNGDVSIPVAVT
jgi:hypothetical protein